MKWIGLTGWKDYIVNADIKDVPEPSRLFINAEHIQVMQEIFVIVTCNTAEDVAQTEILCTGYGVIVKESIEDIRKLLNQLYEGTY